MAASFDDEYVTVREQTSQKGCIYRHAALLEKKLGHLLIRWVYMTWRE